MNKTIVCLIFVSMPLCSMHKDKLSLIVKEKKKITKQIDIAILKENSLFDDDQSCKLDAKTIDSVVKDAQDLQKMIEFFKKRVDVLKAQIPASNPFVNKSKKSKKDKLIIEQNQLLLACFDLLDDQQIILDYSMDFKQHQV